jgi:hypothetical protein
MSAYVSPTTDGQYNGFTQVPNHVLHARDLSYGAKALYSILLSYCFQKDTCFPSYETLMREMHCRSQALASFLKELATRGLITIIRRGQGKTNLYHLAAVAQSTPEPQPQEQPPEAEQACSLKIKEQELRISKREEYEAKEYEGRFNSSTRKAKRSGHDYVKFHDTLDKPQDRTGTTHQPKVGEDNVQIRTPARNIEKIEPLKKIAPPRADELTMYDDIQRGLLLEYISDFAREFHDQAPLTSSTTRAYNLFRQSGVSMETFIDYLYSARMTTTERTATIRKYTERGVKTKMAYFFAVLEDRLGLRQKPLPSGH